MKKIFLMFLLFLSFVYASNGLKLQKINDRVYAIVGELSNRSNLNLANNATFGFIITSEGIILIDSGGTYKGAIAIHNMIKKVSSKPIRIVINTGGQDHRWFGNSYFQKLGAIIIASADSIKDNKKRLKDQLIRLDKLVSKKILKNTKPISATYSFDDEMDVKLGSIKVEIYHKGVAHTLGDSFVWIPKYKIMFAGDIVFTQRMLGIGSQSDYKSWIKVFKSMEQFRPKVIVPGHGKPTTLKISKKDTLDYLKFIDKNVKKILHNDGDLLDTKKVDQSRFKYLQNYKQLHNKNIQRAFIQAQFEE